MNAPGANHETYGTGRALAGACRYGAVRYVVADAFRYAANCHCSDYRRATGSAFKPLAGVEPAKLAVTEARSGC